MGRQTKYTYHRLRRFFKVLRRGGSLSAASGFAGISEVTRCEWENTKPKFSKAVKRWKLRGESRLVAVVDDLAYSGPPAQRLTAAMYLLNTTHGYRQKVEVENTGTVKHEHRHEVKAVFEKLTAGEKNRIRAGLLPRLSEN